MVLKMVHYCPIFTDDLTDIQTVYFSAYNYIQDNGVLNQFDAEHFHGNASEPNLGDIRIVYHPAEDRAPELYSFAEYCNIESTGEDQQLEEAEAPGSLSQEPWRPFPTCLDFEFSEVILDTHMN